MKVVLNSQTNQPEIRLGVKLLTELGVNTLQNSNKKNYKLVNVEFKDNSGKVQIASASIYEGNYSKGGLVVGNIYSATARKTTEGTIYLQMSHLPYGAGLATADMFPDFVMEEQTSGKILAGATK